MGDYNFLRYYISAQNGWNPFDDSVKKIPSVYWLMSFHMKQMHDYEDYEYNKKPVAEFLASILEPSNYNQYVEYLEKEKNGTIDRTTKDKRGIHGSGKSELKLIPGQGLVNDDGVVVVSEEMMNKRSVASDGIFVG